MQSPASASTFQERQLAIERIRSEIVRRQRVMLIGLLPLAAAMALIIPYMQIVITLQDADYYYILERPAWDTYFRLAGAALFAGPLSVVMVVLALRQLDELTPGLTRMLVVGAVFGMIMPLLVGLLTPLNLFIIGITGVSNVTGQGSVQQMIGDWVFSTPMFTFIFWMDWLGPGIFFGLIAGLIFWIIVKIAGPIERKGNAKLIYTGSVAASAVILFLVTVWPYSLFSFMFETFL